MIRPPEPLVAPGEDPIRRVLHRLAGLPALVPVELRPVGAVAEVEGFLEVHLAQRPAVGGEAAMQLDVVGGEAPGPIQESLGDHELDVAAHRELHDGEADVAHGVFVEGFFLHGDAEPLQQHALLMGMAHFVLNGGGNGDLGAQVRRRRIAGVGPGEHGHLALGRDFQGLLQDPAVAGGEFGHVFDELARFDARDQRLIFRAHCRSFGHGLRRLISEYGSAW